MAKKLLFNVYSFIAYNGILKLVIHVMCNKFYTKYYAEFILVYIFLIPFNICVPVYSGMYLKISEGKYFFHALYMVYNPMSKLY